MHTRELSLLKALRTSLSVWDQLQYFYSNFLWGLPPTLLHLILTWNDFCHGVMVKLWSWKFLIPFLWLHLFPWDSNIPHSMPPHIWQLTIPISEHSSPWAVSSFYQDIQLYSNHPNLYPCQTEVAWDLGKTLQRIVCMTLVSIFKFLHLWNGKSKQL